MRQCHVCDRKFGLFEKPQGLASVGAWFCPGCVPKYYQGQKQRVLAELSTGGDPVELFRVTGVTTTDPDDSSHRSILYGHLIFTDKAVVFVQGDKVVTPAINPLIHGGLVGGLIWELQHGRAQRKAHAQAQKTTGQMAGDLREVIGKSDRLIVIPRASIREIKYGWFRGLRIKARTGKESKSFQLPNKRETYEEFRPQLEKYVWG